MKKYRFGIFMAAAAVSLVFAGCGDAESGGQVSGSSETEEAAEASLTSTEGGEVEEVATSYEAKAYTVDEIIEMFGYDPAEYITLGDYDSIVAKVGLESEYTVTDDTIKDYINYNVCGTEEDLESLDEEEPSYTSALYHFADTDRTEAELGDLANIDYVGTHDGEVFDGGSAEGYDLLLGSGSFIDGFEDGIAGHSVGETFDLELTFPEAYGVSDLAGEDVVFSVTLNSIKEPQAASYDTLTDDDINIYTSGSYTTVDDFYEYTKNYLESEYESYYDSDVSDSLFDQLKESSEINIPDEVYEQYVEESMSRQETMATDYGYDSFEDYLTENGYTVEDYEEDAKTALETYLIYGRLMQERDTAFSEDDYEQMLSEIESYYDYMYYQYYGYSFYAYFGSYDAAIEEYFTTYGGEDKCVALTALSYAFDDYRDSAVEAGRVEYSTEAELEDEDYDDDVVSESEITSDDEDEE